MSAARRKGTDAENGVVAALQRFGWVHAERRALAGVNDKGDVTGVSPELVFEVKNAKSFALGEWLDEARVERENARARYGFVWFKRRGKGHAEDWYVLMDGLTLMQLLKQAGY